MLLPHKVTTAFALALFISGLLSSTGHAGVYRWVDEQGRTHFGDRPPTQAPAKNVDLRPNLGTQTPAPNPAERREKHQRLLRAWEEERRQRSEAAAKAKKERAEQARNCTVARDRLRSYKDAAYLYDLDKDGNRQIISDADKQAAIRELEVAIKRHCR